MRTALLHVAYSSRSPSGENLVADAEEAALRAAGILVDRIQIASDEAESARLHVPLTAFRLATARSPRTTLASIGRSKPEVVHVHNLFPYLGTSWLVKAPWPIVATVHNYRPICIAGTLYRDGAICRDCVDGSRLNGIRHGCFQSSVVRSAVTTMGWASTHLKNDPVFQRADLVIFLSESQRSEFVRAGLDPKRTLVRPNFLPDEMDLGLSPVPEKPSFVFAGRLSPEKGIIDLVHVWPDTIELLVLGDGPSSRETWRRATRGVVFGGSRDRIDILKAIGRASALVMPSRWLEPFGLTYIEALSRGTPVVALSGTSMASRVLRDGTGFVADWNQDSLMAVTQKVLDSGGVLREHCRRTFDSRYSESVFRGSAREVYGRAIANHQASHP